MREALHSIPAPKKKKTKRSRANAAMLLDLGHKTRRKHIWEEWGYVETQNLKVFDVPTAEELIQKS
jgi:hypothetical protein